MSPLLNKFSVPLASLCRDEGGATALEWSVLASCIAAVAVSSISNLGQTVAGLFEKAANVIGAYL